MRLRIQLYRDDGSIFHDSFHDHIEQGSKFGVVWPAGWMGIIDNDWLVRDITVAVQSAPVDELTPRKQIPDIYRK